MARRYVRDTAGRFASKGGGGKRKGKLSKSTAGRSAKASYKKASRADRKEGFGASKARKKVIKKQTGKTAYVQKGSSDLGRSKAPRSRTKSQKIRTKIDRKKFANKELRGSEFKGKKKRVTKKAAAAAAKKKKTADLQKRYAEFSKKNKAARKGGLKPKPGETAKQFRGRLKRGAKSAHVGRALREPGGIKEYYGTRSKKKETAKSRRRAESRDTWGSGTGGNRRSPAITKSKQRHAAKMRRRNRRR